jgi:hypothetical protein
VNLLQQQPALLQARHYRYKFTHWRFTVVVDGGGGEGTVLVLAICDDLKEVAALDLVAVLAGPELLVVRLVLGRYEGVRKSEKADISNFETLSRTS